MAKKPKCTCCGNCCRGQFMITLNCLDIMREPRLLEHSEPRKSTHGECGVYEVISGEHRMATKHGDDCHILLQNPHCPFLTEAGCGIYPTRPWACLVFIPGSERCKEIRDKNPETLLPRVSG